MTEKTEEPTPKRKREAREEGQVPRSDEFSGIVVTVGAIAILVVTGLSIAEQMAGFCLQAIEVATRPELTASAVGPFVVESAVNIGTMLAPLLGVVFVLAIFVTWVQTGPVLTIDPVVPDGSNLNVANGLKELFSPKKLVDLAKNAGKLSAMGVVGALVLREVLPSMALTPRGSLLDGTVALAEAVLELSLYLVGGLVLFGVVDLLWQRYQHRQQLMMTKREVEREHKEMEGDPQQENKRKEFHRELLEGSGLEQVEDADACVVNPTHVAVALRYREEEMNAPTVVASGRGVTARKIKKRARRCGVPIVREVELAHSLVELDLEARIPEELFEPVAEVLHYVYELEEES